MVAYLILIAYRPSSRILYLEVRDRVHCAFIFAGFFKFLSNTNNFLNKSTNLIDANLTIRSIWVRVDLGVMPIKSAPHSPDLQNWSLTIIYSLVAYPGHNFFRGKYFIFLQVLSLSRDSKVDNFADFLFFFFLLIIIRSGLLAETRWSVCIIIIILLLEFLTIVLRDGFLTGVRGTAILLKSPGPSLFQPISTMQ